jgi:hypothetical protein
VNAAVIGAPKMLEILKVARKTLCNRVVSSRPTPAIGSLSLAITLKILINRAIRGSRPGAERTVSAISP